MSLRDDSVPGLDADDLRHIQTQMFRLGLMCLVAAGWRMPVQHLVTKLLPPANKFATYPPAVRKKFGEMEARARAALVKLGWICYLGADVLLTVRGAKRAAEYMDWTEKAKAAQEKRREEGGPAIGFIVIL